MSGHAQKLSLAAAGRIRVWCDGRALLDETNRRPWTHPYPFESWECDLPASPGEIVIEVGYQSIDWEVYVALDAGVPGPAMVGEILDHGPHDPEALSCLATLPAQFRRWSSPRYNQITAGYCAGMLEPEEAAQVLRQCLREEYHVPWLKRTTPIMCTATEDHELIANRAVLCNTPHSLSFFCRALAANGLRDEARDLCRRLFGAMITAGSSTLWEEFAPRSSLCHAWGAFCAVYLLRERPLTAPEKATNPLQTCRPLGLV